MSKPNIDFSKMSKTDILESYEMLRASHTLLRCAFGICAMFLNPSSEDEAKTITGSFDSVFKVISDVANRLLEQSKSCGEDSSEQVNS